MQHEMDLDKNGEVFNDALYQKYLTMHRTALEKQQALIKTAALADVALALLLFGKNIVIPGTSLGLQDIPAAIQVLTAFSAFSFLMLSLSFLNAQCYQAVIDQFNIRKAAKYHIDPDFLIAADSFTELYLKAFRKKLNIHGEDFFDAGAGYKIYYTTMTALLTLSMLSILALHVGLVTYGVWVSLAWNWINVLFCCSVVLITLVAILANVFVSFSFNLMGAAEGVPN